MRAGWISRPLADLVASRGGNNKIIKGTQADTPSVGLVQGFSASGPDVWVAAPDYTRDGVVVSAVGARCGKTFLASGAWTAIANTHVLLPGPDIDVRWLWYRTNDEDFWVKGGSAQPFVKVRETLLKPCLVPPLSEQHCIVALLDDAFAGIATAKTNAEKSLRCAREAFEASLTVALGSKGWPERRLGDVCEIARGGSPRPIKAFLTNASDGVNWVKIGDASASSKYIYRTREKIKPTGVSRSRLVHSGDFLLSNSMSFGRPYIMRTSGCIHDGWLVLSKYEDSFDQDFLYLLLGSHFMYQQFDRLAAGSTVRNLNIELASRVSVPAPPWRRRSRSLGSLRRYRMKCPISNPSTPAKSPPSKSSSNPCCSGRFPASCERPAHGCR